MSAPEELKRRGATLYYNGFGFQPPGEGVEDVFVIAKLSRDYEENLWEKVRELSGSESVERINWLGRVFVQLHWSEYAIIEHVLTAMLKVGMSFSPMSKLDPCFTPDDKVFSRSNQEKKWLIQYGQDETLLHIIKNTIGHNISHEWNWVTEEGKNFCRSYRKKLGKSEHCSKPQKHNYFMWHHFQNYDECTLTSKSREVLEITKSETCIICFDAMANTKVMPCGHVVVCSSCSSSLQTTADAHICCYCRCSITSIDSCDSQLSTK